MECSECGGEIVEENGDKFCETCGLKPFGPSNLDFQNSAQDSNSDKENTRMKKGFSEIKRIGNVIEQPLYIVDRAEEIFRMAINEEVLSDESAYVVAAVCSNTAVEISDGCSTRTSIIESSQSDINIDELELLSDRVIEELELDDGDNSTFV